MILKILVPTDGSKTAQKAGAYAVGLAKQLHASIIVISVMDKRSLVSRTVSVGRSRRGAVESPKDYLRDARSRANLSGAFTSVVESLEDYLREAAEKHAGEITKLCEKTGVQSKIVIKPGHPVEEIVKEAEKSNVDLIVVGSHGQSALAAAFLGSVTYGVIHKDTKIPILVVKR